MSFTSVLETPLSATIYIRATLSTTIHELPNHVLVRIFGACLPSDSNARMDAKKAPLVLTHICHRWRLLALRTPALWRTLHLPVPQKTPSTFMPTHQITTLAKLAHRSSINAVFQSKVQRHCTFIHEWIRRAGRLPLSISIPAPEAEKLRKDTLSGGDELSSYFETVIAVGPKIRRLEIVLADGNFVRRLNRAGADTFENLEELVVTYAPTAIHHEKLLRDWERYEIFQAPRLRSLTLKQCPAQCVLDIATNWESLTTLNIEDASVSALGAYLILSRCPELEHLSLEVEDVTNGLFEEPVFSYLPLHHLQSLTIVEHTDSVQDLFACMDVPSLRTVEFYSTLSPSPYHRTSLITLLLRVPGGVRNLTLDMHVLTHQDVVECLSLVPFLAHLSHNRRPGVRMSRRQEYENMALPVSVIDGVLRLLTPSSSSSLLDEDQYERFHCPMLSSLSIRNGLNVSEEAVLKFVNARRQTRAPGFVAKLWSVDVMLTCPRKSSKSSHHSSSRSTLGEVTEYAVDGTQVVLRYPPKPPQTSRSRHGSYSSSPTLRGFPIGRPM